MKKIYLISNIIILLFNLFKLNQSQNSNEEDILLLSASPIATLGLKQYQAGIGYHLALSTDGKYTFISCLTGGFLVFDVSDPINPKLKAKFQGYDVRQIELDDKYAYVIDGVVGLMVFSIENISQIIPISQLQFSESVTSIKRLQKTESLLVVGNGILYSVDITNKMKPSIQSSAGVDKSISYQIVVNKGETYAYVSQGQLGVGIYNISDLKQLNQILLQRPYWIVFYTALHPDEDVLYVVDGWYGLFSTDLSAIASAIPSKPIQLAFTTIAQFPGNVIVGAILSFDSKYLIISLKSIGFKIYDISKSNLKMTPKIVYQLEGSYFMRSFAFSQNNNYLFINNGLQLVIHEKVIPNLNNDFPNVFNTYQSTLTFLGNEFWPYHIHIFQDGKTAAVNVGLIGTKLYDISDIDHPVLLSTINSIQGTSQDYVYAQPNNENILYVGGSQLGIHIFDISDKSQPALISTYAPNPNLQNNCDGLDMSEDRSVVIVGNSDQGISVADFRDLKNPTKWSNWPSLFNSNVKKVKLSRDSKYAYLAALEVGLIILDVSKVDSPQMISIVTQMVGETPNLSIDSQYIFLANGFSGFTIINIKNPYQPFIVSSIAIDGWVMNMFAMFNEKYIIACTAEKGQLTIIDISDKQNPYIFAKYSNIDEHSFSIASTPNYSAAIFIGAKGMRILPLKTNLYIHSQFKEIVVNQSGKQSSRNMDVGESLKVGSTVYITFTSVFVDRELIYQNALFYQNYEIKSLPSYMEFLPSQKQLIIQVSKEGVINNQRGENIVLLQLSAQVTFREVMAIHPAITTELAFGIVQCLTQANYLDQQQFLDSSFNPTKSFYLDFYTMLKISKALFASIDQLIQNSLHSLLKYSKVQYPIRFFVESSLVLNKKSKFDSVIETPSKNVEVLFTILTPLDSDKANGVFIKKSFQGVLAVYSDSLDQLKLEGSLSNINMILNKNIQIANLTALENISIKYTISDGSNFDIDSQDSLNNLLFLSLNKPVQLNKKIQSQLNSQYSKSGLYVAEQFSFKLDSQTFIDLDTYNTNLKYTAYFINSSIDLEEINETTDKIQFNSREITFVGMVKQSDLFKSYRIRVIASDGYSQASDEFLIEFNLMPLSLIIQLIIQIIGPIIGAFGIWRYRSFIHRFTMKKTYTYQKEFAVIGTEYRKKIVLMNSIQNDFEKIWKIYKKENKDYKKEVWENYENNKEIFLDDIIIALEKIYQENPKKYPYIHENEFIFPHSRLNHILQLHIILIFLEQPSKKSTITGLRVLKKKGIKELKNEKNWYRYYVNINIEKGWKEKRRDIESAQNQSSLQELSIQEQPFMQTQQQLAIPLHTQDYNPFPNLEFQDEKIIKELNEHKIVSELPIIKELIKLETYGIIIQQPFRIVPARGESLHLLSSDLISVNAYIKDKGTSCKCLKNCLEIDYKPIGLKQNSPLPSWLNCDIIDDVIYLWGTPTTKDKGNIQLRFNDLFGLTVMQFDLIIMHKDDENNPIKKLTSERKIKIQQRQNQKQSIDEKSKQSKNGQNSFETYLNIQSDNNIKMKRISQYAPKVQSYKQNTEVEFDKENNQELDSIEMLSQENAIKIRQFLFVPSQIKGESQQFVIEDTNVFVKGNKMTEASTPQIITKQQNTTEQIDDNCQE